MNEWKKADLTEGKEPVIPLIGQSVVLYLCPRDRTGPWDWGSDIGSLDYEEEDGLIWGSAFGLCSNFDGRKFADILKDYEVCFAIVPLLEAGRFPSPLGIATDDVKACSEFA